MENEKNSFEFKRRYIIIIVICTVIIAVLGALLINYLYSMGHNGKGFHTEWQASDMLMFFATVLEALGTISLGAISIWQNVQLQKANEQAQKRIEKISNHANEISLVNTLVERESSRINRFMEASDEFTEYAFFIKSAKQIEVDQTLEYNIGIAKLKVFESSQKVIRVLVPDIVNHKEAKNLIEITKRIKNVSDKIYNLILSGSKEGYEEYVDEISKEISEYINAKDKYVIMCQLMINEIMFGKVDLESIKEKYRLNIKGVNHGQAENAQ